MSSLPFDLDDAVNLLARTPATLRAMLTGLPDRWAHGTYAERTFSPFDVVGHLIVGEQTDWIPRARHILAHGQSTPFAAFDRYAQFELTRGRSLADLLDHFDRERTASLAALAALHLTAADLDRAGAHPALGVATLRQLLATWVAHDLNHIAQVARALAAQYADEVGPWKAYLGILSAPVTHMDDDGAARKLAAVSHG
jgi:hypothetical protein